MNDKKNHEIIAEMNDIKAPILSKGLGISINEIFSSYFQFMEVLLHDFSRSLLNRLDGAFLEPFDQINSLQNQIDFLESEINDLKRHFSEFRLKKSLDLNSNIPLQLLNYYQKEFGKLNSVKLVLFHEKQGELVLTVICDKTCHNFLEEERIIYKVIYNAKRTFPLAKEISLDLEGLPRSEKLNNLLKVSYTIINNIE